MQFSVVSLFPSFINTIKQFGVVGRAFEQGLVNLDCVNPRDFTQDKYQTIDDRPYGGGPGMVMMAEPVYQAIQAAKQKNTNAPVVYLSPQGQPLKQHTLKRYASLSGLILLSGRYEGIDQRVIDQCVDEEVSLGDYVLSGGELPAMTLMDGIIRLLPNVLGHQDSAQQDSFERGLLDCPHYTRPACWRDHKVPAVLQSGDHKKVQQWRLEQAKTITAIKRSDLLGF